MRRWRITSAPKALRVRGVSRDNLALVPASLLPRKREWQELANQLPRSQVLIIIPSLSEPQRAVLTKVAAHLRSHGQPVTTLEWRRLSFPDGFLKI